MSDDDAAACGLDDDCGRKLDDKCAATGGLCRIHLYYDYAKMLAKLRPAEHELVTDKARLDWLEQHLYAPGPEPLWQISRNYPGESTNCWQIQHQSREFGGKKSLREAIDGAMQASNQQSAERLRKECEELQQEIFKIRAQREKLRKDNIDLRDELLLLETKLRLLERRA